VAIGFGRTSSQRLSHVGLVVAPRRRASRWWLRGAAVAAVAASAGAAGWLVRERAIPPPQAPAASPAEVRALRDGLEQGRLALRLADARSRELEHQIDTLNQQLAESQEQLTFFRKARDGRR
jgi:hypothetical protein